MAVIPDMVGIVVQDMGKSLAFYRLLGLDIPEGMDNEPYVQVITPNGYRISWNTEGMMQEIEGERWTRYSSRGRVTLAFLCESPSEVDAVYDRMTAAGYPGHTAPWDAFWGQRYAQISDPDGLVVDIFASLPGA